MARRKRMGGTKPKKNRLDQGSSRPGSPPMTNSSRTDMDSSRPFPGAAPPFGKKNNKKKR